ncbi:MAG: M56 family metallopeptidase [Myxococcales bacterium]
MSGLSAWVASALLAWLGLPLLWLAARGRPGAAPASRARTLTFALGLATALLFVPFGSAAALLRASRPVPSAVASLPGLTPDAARAALAPLAALALAWLALVALGLARLAWTFARDGSLSRGEAPLPEGAADVVDRLARELEVAPPRLVVSRRAALPFVLALPRPTVVLPEVIARALDAPALELVLRHELTHLARGDHWTAVALELFKVPFTLHPFAARLCQEIGLAREMAVDARLGAVAPRAYAHLLVDVAELHRFGPREAGEVALEPHSLERRIQMLTNPTRHRSAPLLPALALAALLAAGAMMLPSLPAFAEGNEPDGSTIALTVGNQRLLHFSEVARIAIGDPTVADVRPFGKTQVLVWATGRGRTTLLVWTADGQRHTYLLDIK